MNAITARSFNRSAVLAVFVLLFSFNALGELMSEEQIKQMARNIAEQAEGQHFTGGKFRKIYAIDRTIYNMYDVRSDWQLSPNAKKLLIHNLNVSGVSKDWFSQKIDTQYIYMRDDAIVGIIKVKHQELSPVSFDLGEPIDLTGHEKAKGMSFNIRPPLSWKVEEGSGPNVVKKFSSESGVFAIMTKDAATFQTREQYRKLLSNPDFRDRFMSEDFFNSDCAIREDKIVTVNSYPTLTFTADCYSERAGIELNFVAQNWIVFHEDKMLMLQGSTSDLLLFEEMKKLFMVVVLSVQFPEQFN